MNCSLNLWILLHFVMMGITFITLPIQVKTCLTKEEIQRFYRKLLTIKTLAGVWSGQELLQRMVKYVADHMESISLGIL